MSMVMLIGTAFPLGTLLGHTGRLRTGIKMGVFRATRPLTDREMVRPLLRSALYEILYAWLAFVVLLGMVHLILIGRGETEAIARFWERIFVSGESPFPLWLRLPFSGIGLFVALWSLLCLASR